MMIVCPDCGAEMEREVQLYGVKYHYCKMCGIYIEESKKYKEV